MSTHNGTRKAFEGKDFFIGIDVSKKNWVIGIRENDMLLKYQSMEPHPEKLYKYMERNYPGGRYHTVYEAGFCGFWAHRDLTSAGFTSIVVHAADVPTTDSERDQKTDAIDARKLAEELEKGKLKCIYIPSEEAERIRALGRLVRKTCVKEKTRWKNRMTAHLDFYGIQSPKHSPQWPGWYMEWLKALELDYGPYREAKEFMLEEYKQLKDRTAGLKKKLKKRCADYFGKDLMGYLYSLPGIGWDTVLTLVTELIEIERFPEFKHICRYTGLIPSRHQTGVTDRDKGITRRRNRYLRYILIEASWIALRKDPELYASYRRYVSRMKPQKAIIRIAKKLLKRIYCIWKERRPYEYRYPSDN